MNLSDTNFVRIIVTILYVIFVIFSTKTKYFYLNDIKTFKMCECKSYSH